MPKPKVLRIKPAYPHLVRYSQRGDPLFYVPDFSPEIGPVLPDKPTRCVSIEEDRQWLATLRQASDAND